MLHQGLEAFKRIQATDRASGLIIQRHTGLSLGLGVERKGLLLYIYIMALKISVELRFIFYRMAVKISVELRFIFL